MFFCYFFNLSWYLEIVLQLKLFPAQAFLDSLRHELKENTPGHPCPCRHPYPIPTTCASLLVLLPEMGIEVALQMCSRIHNSWQKMILALNDRGRDYKTKALHRTKDFQVSCFFTFNILTEYYSKPIKVARSIRPIYELRNQGLSDLLRGVELQFIINEIIFLWGFFVCLF